MGTDTSNRVDEAQEYALDLNRLHGTRRAARMLGISPESFARLCARLRVHNGTVELALAHKRTRAAALTPAQRVARAG
jgi:hypothetical protein